MRSELASAEALKLTAYFGERSRSGSCLLADELLELYGRHRIRTSILLRGAQGFGAKHRLRTDRLLTLSEDLPVVALAIDEHPQRIEAVAGETRRLMNRGLVTLERLWAASGAPAPPPDGLDASEPDMGLKLSAYVGRYERADGAPAFVAACRALHELGVAGATVLLGVDGTVSGRRERARFFARNAHVPTMLLAVGERREMLAGLSTLRSMLPQALFTLERLQVCKRDGQLVDLPKAPGAGLQKLMVVTSEATRHDGRPVHLELVRRLRAARSAGATSLKGIWGFHGEHQPHGDRLLSLRRHVPVVTVIVDSPERIAALFPIVDELTSERGLVTSEAVPANMALSARL